jgi:hypothetical protein
MGTTLIRNVVTTALILAAAAVTAQERPDFSGAWTTYRGNPNAAGAAARPAVQLPLKPQAQAAADAYRSLIDGTNYAPGNACVGYGMPESMMSSGGYPMEIIQRPEQLLIVYELHNELRRIYLDAEARDPATVFPERNGYSTARWEGDRLVVETTRLKTQVDTRYPHSDEAKIREEYYFDTPLPDGTQVLAADLVLEDPLWLEEPFKATKRWQALDGYHVMRYECNEPVWLDEMAILYQNAGLEMVQE